MTGDDYKKAITVLKMTQVGSARFFGVNDRTVRFWISGRSPVPRVVSMLLRVMVELNLDPMHVLALDASELVLEDGVASA